MYIHRGDTTCGLNYKTISRYHSPGLCIGATPTKPCPKPKTIAELEEAKRNIHKWGKG